MIRKIILAVIAFAPLSALAQGFVPLVQIPGLTTPEVTSVVNSDSLALFFNNLYKYAIGAAATLAVIEIIWGGLEISTKDSVSKNQDGKERIRNAIFGLVLVLSPALVFTIINPAILNLSLNLPPLDTRSGQVGTGAGTGSQQTADAGAAAATAAGCTVTGTLLKTAVCPTQQAAQSFATACSSGMGNVPFFTTDHKATCGTGASPRYTFVDTSQSTGFVGWVNFFSGYSYYEPVASTPANSNNGRDAVQFASACSADGGTTCMSAVKIVVPLEMCTTGSARPSNSGSNTFCWGITLSCTEGNVGVGGCSRNPGMRIVN